MNRAPNTQIYIRLSDKRRLDKLATREDRPSARQLKVLIDEACEKRGLDPRTVEPIEQATAT